MAANNNKPDMTTTDPKEDVGGSTGYKLQLDQAALDAHRSAKPPQQPAPGTNPVLEKVSQYVPAVGKLLGGNEVKKPAPLPQQIPGPPHRPEHDTAIEEFLRDQHRSKTEALLKEDTK